MSSVVDDLKNMDGPLPGPLANLKELAQIGSVVMRMNNVQKMFFLAVVLQVVASFTALSVTSSSIKASVKEGRSLMIFGALLMAFAGMSAFYGMVKIPKIGTAASGQKIAMGSAALMTLGIIAFSIGYSNLKKKLGDDADELKKVLTMNILAILFSVAVFAGIGMKYHPVLPVSSFGSYDFRYL